jgi:hypothetical protein
VGFLEIDLIKSEYHFICISKFSSKIMKTKELQFEVKYPNNGEWIEVSGNIFLRDLLTDFDRITPIITEMLEGQEIVSPSAAFRIKIRQGARNILVPSRMSNAPKAFN